jgi:SAM-dependent methyltransferase
VKLVFFLSNGGSFEFFEDYCISAQKLAPDFYNEIRKILNRTFTSFHQTHNRKPIILDVGSAGIMSYDTNLVEKVVILDLFSQPDGLILSGDPEWIIGDILSDNIADKLKNKGKFDFIVISGVLHHLCDERNNIIKNVNLSLNHSISLLSDDGAVCIFESTCPDIIAKFEDLIYPVYSRMLVKIFKFAFVRLLCLKEITTALVDNGFAIEHIFFKQPRWIHQLYWHVPTSIYFLKTNAIFGYKKIKIIENVKGEKI